MADWNMGPYRPNPLGDYNSATNYRYLDIVTYNGASYINCNLDTIDGVSCIGIAPSGMPQSTNYWQCIANKGDKGDIADRYLPYITVSDGRWHYSDGDKIYIPNTTGVPNTIVIDGLYDGCCGIMLSKKDITLPANSYKSADYNYVSLIHDDDYYFYTFTYANIGSGSHIFIWHRSVVRHA